MERKINICLKVAKYLTHRDAYAGFLKELPAITNCNKIDLTVLFHEIPNTDRVISIREEELTIEEYLKQLDKHIKIIDNMPTDLKVNIVKNNLHHL
jgi:hypothetical protein